MSNNRPPTYTFRRPKNPKVNPPMAERYTPVDVGGYDDSKYSKYTFWMLILFFIIIIVLAFVVWKKGIPVRIRA